MEPQQSQRPHWHRDPKSTRFPQKWQAEEMEKQKEERTIILSWVPYKTVRWMPAEIPCLWGECQLRSHIMAVPAGAPYRVQTIYSCHHRDHELEKPGAGLLKGQWPETNMCSRSSLLLRKSEFGPHFPTFSSWMTLERKIDAVQLRILNINWIALTLKDAEEKHWHIKRAPWDGNHWW